MAKDGYKVIFIVAGFPGGRRKEMIDGYQVIRVGNRWSVYFQAYQYYKKYLQGWADLVIEEINTFPFLSQFYVHPVKSPINRGAKQFNRARQKRILIVYQLCREIWFYQISFPLSLIGYLLEPLYLWLLRKNKVITISQSTKNDLARYGFKKRNIKIMTPGIEIAPIDNLYCHSAFNAESIDSRFRGNDSERIRKIKKFKNFTLLSLGAIRKMKRPDHQLQAYEIAKQKIPGLKLKIAGTGQGKYYHKIMKLIKKSPYRKDIEYLGKVKSDDKIELMQKCHLILVTSVKEGWGLIVTEANSQGTPAVVYDVDGLRDSVKDNKTGLIAKKNTPKYLARRIVELAEDKKKYARLQKAAWKWSQSINFDNCYKKFLEVINEK